LDGRRGFIARNGLHVLIATNIIFKPFGVQAQEEEEEEERIMDSVVIAQQQDRGGKPFAPPDALLPVTRLKLWLNGIDTLSATIQTTKDPKERYEIVVQMNATLSDPPKLFYSEQMRKRTISPTTAQLSTTVSAANKDQYQTNRNRMGVGDKVAAMLNQADVERQWGMLQYAESKREEANEMRAAFNCYTKQLTFGDNYVLNGSKEERKKMIRNDELPSLTAVITSDLDQRDLYRNQFLTSIEDARAEVMYQSKQTMDQVDVSDIIDLVSQANTACENWFSLIAPQDVKAAIDTLR
jgi:hypothetical protein